VLEVAASDRMVRSLPRPLGTTYRAGPIGRRGRLAAGLALGGAALATLGQAAE